MASIPTFPSIDLSKFDLSKLDVTKLDLSSLPRIDVPGVDTDKVLGVLRDAAYVVIGFGVLSVQQVQVRRRELVDRLGAQPVVQQLGLGKEQLEEMVKGLEARFSQLDDRLDQLEGKIDAAVDALGERLPEQAGAFLGQAHEVAKAARKQVRGLLVNAA